MITLSNEAKNNITITNESRVSSPTWDEATMTWDESLPETWDSQSLPIWSREAKNSLSITLETK